MSEITVYEFTESWINRTLIWENILRFHYANGCCHVINYSHETATHFEQSSWLKIFQTRDFEEHSASGWKHQKDFLRIGFKKESSWKSKELKQFYYCPFDREYWYNRGDCSLISMIEDEVSKSTGVSPYWSGKTTDDRGGLALYLKLLSLWESQNDKSKVLIKINPHNRKEFLKLSRRNKRIMMCAIPWTDSGGWRSETTGQRYNATYGLVEPSFTPTKKAIDRRLRKVKNRRQLSKREQEFFSLMSGVNSLKQLKNKIQ